MDTSEFNGHFRVSFKCRERGLIRMGAKRHSTLLAAEEEANRIIDKRDDISDVKIVLEVVTII